MQNNALYLFCLASASRLSGANLQIEQPVCLQYFGDIAAVVKTVPLEEFCGAAAESRMQDLAWIGPQACCHEQVIEQVMQHSPVIPVRFGTVFSSMSILEELLKSNQGAISQFLEQVTNKQEWAVKGLLDKSKAKAEMVSAALNKSALDLGLLPPGMRYFREQRIRADTEQEFISRLKKVCQEMLNELNRYAFDFCQRQLLSRETTGNGRDMISNWAFLLSKDRVTDFHTRINQMNADGLQWGLSFEYSGPWPPYSFSPVLKTEPEK